MEKFMEKFPVLLKWVKPGDYVYAGQVEWHLFWAVGSIGVIRRVHGIRCNVLVSFGRPGFLFTVKGGLFFPKSLCEANGTRFVNIWPGFG